MTFKLSRSAISASVLLALASGAAFAAKVPAGTALAAKQELIRNNGSETETLDPAVAESVGANNLTRDLFEGLTATDADGKVVPGVAESWKQVNPTTWVFKLRKNAKWSNGEPVVASDFVYGWQRFIDPKTASPYASTYGAFILNGIEASEGKKAPSELGVKAIDKYTLEVKTPYPVAFLPDVVSNLNLGPVNKAAIEKYGKEWTKPGKLVSNGAFVLKDWQVNSKVVIEKNPQYWDKGNVQLTKVTYLPVEDGFADVKLFQSGENDWVYQLPPATYEKYKQELPKDIRNAPMLGLRYYSFNVKDPVMKDKRVRQALSMVIDRDLLAQKITADGQVPAYGVIVRGTAGADVTAYEWAKWPMAKRVEEAKKLLAAAGVKPGSKIKFTYNTSEYHKKMAIFAASEWKSKLGLNTEMENMEFKVLLKKRHDGDFQIARNGWVADYNDATTFLTLVQCGSDQNDNGNCNPKAEELIKQGNQSTDPAKRKAALTQAAKMIMDDYPMLPLLQYTVPRLVKSYVGGYSTKNPMDRYRSKDIYIIKH
ncbi:peptide ABC transporter substrate-binding protein [Craterilacuibacter sinensis]|uniref:Peptide ABC transporter substrate-binding protein n=1 Tax=Craterilacuibacter sinensis TaxID=2686017 RepID=A0A845BVE1_9NEIS|nr:peptide ABC transporter substrate-binding protein [Craterilacuibacter sinensis]MXR36483.1 peptide ABC transporter substrate-binding protein [Craterilacuibacter sinensis]RQW28538.1 peptide ABC transporter substrate-binding protein [Rhodobacteraceae bacterium CH30]